jgi:hypothetical protein
VLRRHLGSAREGLLLFCSSATKVALLNTETSTDTNKKVGLEVNVEKTKYMLVSRDQNAGI